MGVQSSILPIFMPALARALRADWAPGPGVLVRFPPRWRWLELKVEGKFGWVEVGLECKVEGVN